MFCLFYKKKLFDQPQDLFTELTIQITDPGIQTAFFAYSGSHRIRLILGATPDGRIIKTYRQGLLPEHALSLWDKSAP